MLMSSYTTTGFFPVSAIWKGYLGTFICISMSLTAVTAADLAKNKMILGNQNATSQKFSKSMFLHFFNV